MGQEQFTENDIKKKYLRRYQQQKATVRKIDAEIEEIRELKECAKAIVNDGMPHGSGKTDLSDYAAELDELERKRSKERYLRVKCFVEIENQIKLLEDEDENNVLVYRYIKGYGWNKIAEEMGYSTRHVTRIHGNALKKIKLPKDVLECPINM